jgi:uncharacterized protein (TIGR01777 family)
MTGKRIVVGGASGLIGTALCGALTARGDDVLRLVRHTPAPTSEDTASGSDQHTGTMGQGAPGAGGTDVSHEWNPQQGLLNPAALEGADAVVVLNGVPIGDKRWSDERKQLILTSRSDAVATVARTMAAMAEPPAVLVTASAVGIYGDRGDEILDESSERGSGFFSDVCTAWEQAGRVAQDAGVRVVHARTGIVLSDRGGALKQMLTPFKLGVGGRIGDGKQWWSWISDADCIAALQHCIDNEISGPVNVVSPNPVTNAEFTKALGGAVHRPTILPTPKLALKAKLGGELAQAVGYVSHRVQPKALLDSGFVFQHETVDEALSAAVG